MFFSAPFVFFLLADSVVSKSFRPFIFNFVAVVILLILAFTRFSNPYIYPILQNEVITQRDYNLTHSPFDTSTLISIDNLHDYDYFDNDKIFKIYQTMDLYREYTLKKGSRITPVKIMISGHPDILGISYKLQIDINDTEIQNKMKKYILTHHKDIFLDIDKELPDKLKDVHLTYYKYKQPNIDDNIYAGGWYYNDKETHTGYTTIGQSSIIEKYLGWLVLMFNPMFIWIYLIILILQYLVVRKRYRLLYKN
ncbi:MAG: hypothetical protein ABXS93_07375 [Sulfurimonas sp.]